ncbi:hypothetical protein [Streptomyces sp. CC210A]|uniref:hypothetical protein n=1 Tax=Streptomyces sp. CC210A TaxID=2898184 RepID=UPI001F2F17E1|nr:hypothetical protein [Streptomyces sp. CC210A]
MSAPVDVRDAAAGPVAAVRPWQSLASLGITEHDLAAVRTPPDPEPASLPAPGAAADPAAS